MKKILVLVLSLLFILNSIPGTSLFSVYAEEDIETEEVEEIIEEELLPEFEGECAFF